MRRVFVTLSRGKVKTFNLRLAVTVVTMLVVSIGLPACAAKAQSPSDVARSWARHSEKADGPGLGSLLSSESRAAFGSSARLAGVSTDDAVKILADGMSADMAKKGGVHGVDVVAERITGDAAEVDFVVRYASVSEPMVLKLVRESGAWKIIDWAQK